MSRHQAAFDVVYVEEPVPSDEAEARLETRADASGVIVAVPRLPAGADPVEAQRCLLRELVADRAPGRLVLWYYTPMALPLTRDLPADLIVFDCMDELSAFRFAPPELLANEAALMARADIVFTGGASLYEAKRHRHPNVHAFPSSIDFDHFAAARGTVEPPADQAALPRPRLGFFGVVDERMDLGLVGAMAALRPDWQFVMIGPVVKIDPATLPRAPNLHWLGGRGYADLPRYAAGWDVALMPFALNESTRFISPTKTPEYLAAGLPVVSTPIADVVRPYGEEGLVSIAEDAEGFVRAAEARMATAADPPRRAAWLARVDDRLRRGSWDRTWSEMMRLMDEARAVTALREDVHV